MGVVTSLNNENSVSEYNQLLEKIVKLGKQKSSSKTVEDQLKHVLELVEPIVGTSVV